MSMHSESLSPYGDGSALVNSILGYSTFSRTRKSGSAIPKQTSSPSRALETSSRVLDPASTSRSAPVILLIMFHRK